MDEVPWEQTDRVPPTSDPDDRCPSCGKVLGDRLSLRYRGALTVIRYRVDGEDGEDGEPVELEHICGD